MNKDIKRRGDGRLYNPYATQDPYWIKAREVCMNYNASRFWEDRGPFEDLKKLFAHCEDDMELVPPFFCDLGEHIYVGKNFHGNTNMTILDEADVRFGDNVYVGPNVSIYTPVHPFDAYVRSKNMEIALPVTIGNDVWIAGNVVINPGVTIGDDVVIGSGSVVTHDLPSHSLCAGNPAKVIRGISDEERNVWKEKYRDYREEL